jgi:hypothetical protein
VIPSLISCGLQITKESVGVLKVAYKDQMSKRDWNLLRKLKELFAIE